MKTGGRQQASAWWRLNRCVGHRPWSFDAQNRFPLILDAFLQQTGWLLGSGWHACKAWHGWINSYGTASPCPLWLLMPPWAWTRWTEQACSLWGHHLYNTFHLPVIALSLELLTYLPGLHFPWMSAQGLIKKGHSMYFIIIKSSSWCCISDSRVYLVTSVHSQQCQYTDQSPLLRKQDQLLNKFFNYKIRRLGQMIYRVLSSSVIPKTNSMRFKWAIAEILLWASG